MVVYQSGGGAATNIKETALSTTLKQKLIIAEYFIRGTTTSLTAVELDAGLVVSADVASTNDSYICFLSMKNDGVPTNSTSVQLKFNTTGGDNSPNMDVGTNSVPTCEGIIKFAHGPTANDCSSQLTAVRDVTAIKESKITGMGIDPMTSAHDISVIGRSGKASVTMSFSILILRIGGTA